MLGLEFLSYESYEWELDGNRQLCSSWLCLPKVELLQYKVDGGGGGWW